MFYTTKGLILRTVNYKDNDLLLTVLTEDMGLLTMRAQGVKRKNSRLRSGCQLLSYSEFALFEKNGYYKVNECEPIRMFDGIRTDIELLSLGSYFSQVLETVANEDVTTPELLSLGLNCLYALDAMKKPQELVKAVFELRVAVLAGFCPDIACCGACGSETAREFYFQQGQLFCDDCSGTNGYGMFTRLSDSVLAAMRYIISCDKNKIFAFKLSESAMKELGETAEKYLLNQLEQSFSALSFYKRLFVTV